MSTHRPSRTAATAAALAVALLAACSRKVEPPARDGAPRRTSAALWANGGFESGLTGWTSSPHLNGGFVTFPPNDLPDLILVAGGTDLTRAVTGPAGSLIPAGLTSASSLRVPRDGSGVAVVNELGAARNVNVLSQVITLTHADVDPTDGLIHLRFLLAPVLEPSAHAAGDQPYYLIAVENVTRAFTILIDQYTPDTPGVPWKTDNGRLYTDWQSYDYAIAPYFDALVGEDVRLQVIAAGCTVGDHFAEVYVDAVGPRIPGPGVTVTAPSEVAPGGALTYTYRYENGGPAETTHTTIDAILPAGTTFASLSAPGASCTTPAVGGTGHVICDVGTVNPYAAGSFDVNVNVTAGAGSILYHGDYRIRADGVPALLGPSLWTWVASGMTFADVSATVTDGVAALTWGGTTTYTLTVHNAGPAAADTVFVADQVPPELASRTWTCAGTGGAVCPGASGSGDVLVIVPSLPAGGTLTYTMTATVGPGTGLGMVRDAAMVSLNGTAFDTNPINNYAVDDDDLVAPGDLYALDVVKAGTGQGTVLSGPDAIRCGTGCASQSADFALNGDVVLTAIAARGHTFAGWSGACTGPDGLCTVSMAGPRTAIATFSPILWTIAASSSTPALGAVSCDNPAATGTASTCTLTPAAHALLLSLTDDGADVTGAVSGGAYTIANVTADHTVVATFQATASSVALAPSPASPIVYGQPLTLTATVSGLTPAGTPGGTVDFLDGGAAIAGCAGVAVAAGVATCSPTLAVGVHTLSAAASGDGTWNGSTSAGAAFTVSRASTSVALADSPAASSLNGVPIALTATVSVAAPSAASASGAIDFTDDGAAIPGCSAVPLSGGVATCTTPAALGQGSHTLAAAFVQTASLAASSGSLAHDVLRVTPAVTLTTDGSPSPYGAPVTLGVTVAHALGTPTGTVTVSDGGAPLCTVALSGGAASCATTGLAVGAHTLTASYGGALGFLPATSDPLGQLVVRATTTSSLASDRLTSVRGQAVTFTAPDAPSVVVPTGTMSFRDGTTVICSAVPIASGSATCAASGLAVGPHAVTARYDGSAGYAPSTSFGVTLLVGQAAITTALATSLPVATYGTAVTFTATVSAVAPGAGTPDGTVTFSDGAAVLGSATLSGGVASLTTSALHAGVHAITAAYGGSVDYAASGSSAVTEAITAAATQTAVVSGPSPSVTGQPVTWTATVTHAGGTPAGTVTFLSDGAALGTGALDGGGVARFTSAALAVGTHALTARYEGALDWDASTSAPATQVVDRAPVSAALAASPQPTVFGQPLTLTVTLTVPAPGAGAPTGTATFRDGGAALGTAAVQPDGTASLTLASLPVGAHTLSASYGGDAAFLPATATSVSHSVGQASVGVALTPAPSPSRFGEDVTFTVAVTAVSPGAGTPSGLVTVREGGATLGTATLSGGQGSFHTAALPVGTHALTADYGGDASFDAGSGSGSQTVQRSDAAVGVASAPAPSRFGQPVTFTAAVTAVAPGAGAPTGAVTFREGATTLGGGTLVAGTATLTTSALAVGSHTVTADYAGDASFNAASGAATQTVQKADAAVAVATSLTPSSPGQAVTFTATVAALAPGAGTPSGTVTFKDGAATLGAGTLAAGVATFTTSSLATGSHAVTAEYGGDGSFNGASGATTQVVQRSGSAVVVTSSATPSRFGQQVTFTATVTAVPPGAGTPSGTVTFQEGATPLGAATLDGTGVARLGTAALAVGGHTVTASYAGDTAFEAASGTIAQAVQKADAAVALASSAAPARSGQAVTFTATVTAVGPGAGTPSGTVTFLEGATTLGTGTLASGVATFTTAALGLGSHGLTASYAGDASFNAATGAATQAVQKADAAVAVAASPAPATFGQPLTLSATVTAVAPGAGTPSGAVTFREGATTLGTGTLAAGVATCTVAGLAVGAHTVTASYPGDGAFNAVDGTGTATVQAAPTQVALVAAPSPAMYGQAVTVTATVSAVAAAAGVPTGTVTFKDGGAILGTGTLSGGVASVSAAHLAAGAHALTAEYGGAASFQASQGSASLTVNKGSTAVAVASAPSPSRYGRPVVLTATVTSPHATPDGAVTFKDGGTTLGSATLAAGVGRITVRTLAKGTHPIVAEYAGSDAFAAASGTLAPGHVVENTPPVAGSGSALALGVGHAVAASADASGGALDGSRTFELWLQAAWTSAADVGAHPTLLRLAGPTADRLAIGVTPDRTALTFTLGAASGTVAAPLDDGAWHHVAVVLGDASASVVVDGALAGSVAGTLGDGPSGAFTLGEGFLGQVDEVRAWSARRTVAELSAALRTPVAADAAGLIALWRLDEGAGATLYDAGPAALDLAADLGADPFATAFVPSRAWRAREARQDHTLAIDAGHDVDGDPLTVTVTAQPAHGSASVSAAAAQVGYRPDPGYLGADQLAFTVGDGAAQSSFTVDLTVIRPLVCQASPDCADGDLCVEGTCTAPSRLDTRSGGCATGGGAAILSALLSLALLGRRRAAPARGGGR
jgi:uncharacterized repeat protein (TIGR01451 family)